MCSGIGQGEVAPDPVMFAFREIRGFRRFADAALKPQRPEQAVAPGEIIQSVSSAAGGKRNRPERQ